jgi:GTP-binding protein
MYNPELLVKERLLAISKSDMLDEEMKEQMEANIPKDLPHIFISGMTGENLKELKDLIWKALNK